MDRRRKSKEFGCLSRRKSSDAAAKNEQVDTSHINTKFILSAASSLLDAFVDADVKKTGYVHRSKVQEMIVETFEGDMSQEQASDLLDYFDAEGGVLEFEDFLDLYRHIVVLICKRTEKSKSLKYLKSDRQCRKEGSTRHNCTWIYPKQKEEE